MHAWMERNGWYVVAALFGVAAACRVAILILKLLGTE